MDGVSDISDVISRFFTYTGNVVLGRIVSIMKYQGKEKLNPLIQTLIDHIPDEINITNTSLYI
jgi:hypothetical protein